MAFNSTESMDEQMVGGSSPPEVPAVAPSMPEDSEAGVTGGAPASPDPWTEGDPWSGADGASVQPVQSHRGAGSTDAWNGYSPDKAAGPQLHACADGGLGGAQEKRELVAGSTPVRRGGSAPKRARTPTGAHAPAIFPLQDEEAEKQVRFADVQAAVTAALQLALPSLVGSVATGVATTFDGKFDELAKRITAADTAITESHTALSGQLASTGERLDRQEKEQAEIGELVADSRSRADRMESAIKVLQAELAVAKKADPVPPSRGDGQWDRAADGTVFRLSAGATVARAQVEKIMEQLAREAGLARNKEEGAPVFTCNTKNPFGKSFLFQSDGVPSVGERNVRQIWESLRGSDGVWKEMHVSAPDGSQVRVYCSLDTSPKTSAEQRIGKLFTKFLKSSPKFERRQVDFHKRDLAVLVDWRQVARVACPSRDQQNLLVNSEALGHLQITKEEILELFQQAIREGGAGGGASQVRWESCI